MENKLDADFYQLIKVVKCKNADNKDIIFKIIKNERTGEKKIEYIPTPEFSFYYTKDFEKYYGPNSKESLVPVDAISIDEVKKVDCKYKNLFSTIKKIVGGNLFNDNNVRENHLLPMLHGTDIDLEDYYIGKHYEQYPYENSKGILTKGYFDIECYTEHYKGFPDPDLAECPIDIIGYFDDIEYTFYGFIWNNPNVKKQIEEFRKPENLNEFKNRIIKKYKDKYNLNISINLEWFDKEIDVINAYFRRLDINKPDFNSSWNGFGFDIPYIRKRTINLIEDNDIINSNVYKKYEEVGISADDVLCSDNPDFKDFKYTYFYSDSRSNDIADKGDYYVDISFTNHVDLMYLFANLRKIFGKRESYELDAIAAEELNEHKEVLDPNNEGITIKNIISKDYARYIEYNIHDVILLYLLEEKNNDIDQLYSVASMTETRVHKCLKKTVCLKNLARKFYYQQGFIMSNNHNTKYSKDKKEKTPSDSFRGAYVGDPNLNDYVGTLINGKHSKFIHENVIDFDLSSLYPSITLAFNISTFTLVGRVIFENDKNNDKASNLFDRINSRDYINLAIDEFDAPNSQEILQMIYDERENNNG